MISAPSVEEPRAISSSPFYPSNSAGKSYRMMPFPRSLLPQKEHRIFSLYFRLRMLGPLILPPVLFVTMLCVPARPGITLACGSSLINFPGLYNVLIVLIVHCLPSLECKLHESRQSHLFIHWYTCSVPRTMLSKQRWNEHTHYWGHSPSIFPPYLANVLSQLLVSAEGLCFLGSSPNLQIQAHKSFLKTLHSNPQSTLYLSV